VQASGRLRARAFSTEAGIAAARALGMTYLELPEGSTRDFGMALQAAAERVRADAARCRCVAANAPTLAHT
jgi:hypothetical protein